MHRLNTTKKQRFWSDLVSGKFAEMVADSAKGQVVCNSGDLKNILKPLVEQEPDVEQFWTFFLNAKNRIITMEKVATGTLTAASVYPRELVKKMIQHHAAAMIAAHNHPSGDVQPSPEDKALTVSIFFAMRTIGATLHEHIIVSKDGYYSFADMGIMAELASRFETLFHSAMFKE